MGSRFFLKKKIFTLFIMTLIFSTMCKKVSVSEASEDIDFENKKKGLCRILFLNRTVGISPWSLDLLNSCRESLKKWGISVQIMEENISVLSGDNQEIIKASTTLMEAKYKGKVDFIVARHFSESLYKIMELFPEVPVIVPAVDESEINENQKFPKDLYIGLRRLSPAITTTSALKISQNTKRVIIVSGKSRFGELLKKRAFEEMGLYFKGAEIDYWSGLPTDELIARVSQLTEDSIIIFLISRVDRDGVSTIPRRVVHEIAGNSGAPVYGVASSYFQNGIVGGYVDSSEKVGEFTAGIILKLINNKSVEPVIKVKDYGRFVFDWKEMVKWDLPFNKIPADSVVFNRPDNFLERHKWVFGLLCVISFLSISLFFLILFYIINRNKVQSALRISKDRYLKLFNDSPVSLWEEDFTDFYEYLTEFKKSGVRNFRKFFRDNPEYLQICAKKIRIIDINDATIRLYKASAKNDLMGHFEETFTKKSYEVFLEEVIALAAGDTEFESEAEVKDFKGEILMILISLKIYKERNSYRALVAMMDITESKKGEEERDKLKNQLLQSQKMESVGRLAGGIAHDYNNALSIITGFTELAVEDSKESTDIRNYLVEVLKACNSAKEITKKLLAFARKQTVTPQIVDLNDSVDGMINMLKRLIGENVELEWNPGKDVWPVEIDPTQLDQILVNLCVNARDAVSGEGMVFIETSNILCDEEFSFGNKTLRNGEYVVLIVSDDGCGMEKNILENIFEPFFTTKEVNKGTGLGLAMVYGIVTQSKGFINVYSEPGEGSTFRIYFPRQKKKTEAINRATPSTIPKGDGETILVVEDELPVLKLTRKMLSSLGYNVLGADTCQKAIDIANEHKGNIDLVLTDVIMPKMNGKLLSEHLRSVIPEIRIIFMSGYSENVIQQHGVFNGGTDFIQKPFSRKEIALKVRSSINS